MGYFCGKGFLTTDGATWQHSRKLLKQTFSKSNISELGFLAREVNTLLARIPNNGETVDLQPLLSSMFLNISLHFLLGIDPSEESHEAPCTSEEFVEAFHTALFDTGLRLVLGHFRGLAPKRRFNEARLRAHEYLEFHIKQAQRVDSSDPASSASTQKKQRSMIDGLVFQTDDIEYIRSQILQGIMASQETTAVLISNTIFLLSRNQECWEELRKEVSRYGDELLSFDALTNSRILQNLLKESLRLHPVFPIMSRVCLRDTSLPFGGGPAQDKPIFVAQGTEVRTSFYALHRNQYVFGSDVDAFVPSRWDKIKPKQWEYLPFGGGQRACLGQEKVLAEAAFVLAQIAQSFEKLESRDEKAWDGVWMLTAKNKNGCKVALYKSD